MSLAKAVFLAALAFVAMSSAGYLTADLALRGSGPDATSAGNDVLVVGSALQGSRQQQVRPLGELAATASPSATLTAEPTATLAEEPSPTDTPAPPPPTATPEPPTATPEPPTPTLEPPTPTPEPPTPTPEPPTPTPEPPTPTPEPPTPTPEPEPASPPPAGSGLVLGSVTPYSDALAGSTLGCNGYGAYDPDDVTVIAVGPEHYEDWPCGTSLGVCAVDAETGTVTSCIVGVRQDSCPGCTGHHLDVSRAAFEVLCGPSASRCPVVITVLP